MSDPNSPGPEKPSAPKKGVSPARNLIGLVVLIAVLIIGYFEYGAKSGYNAAVSALNTRVADEEKGLMSVQEAETLLGRAPDGPGVDINENNQGFTKTTYTWTGLFLKYPVIAYYTKGASPGLHHFETEEQKYAPQPPSKSPSTVNEPVDAEKIKAFQTSGKPQRDVESAKPKTDAEPAKPKTDAEPAKPKTEPEPAKPKTDPEPAKAPN